MSLPILRPSNLPILAVCACYEPAPATGEDAARGRVLDGIFRQRLAGGTAHDINSADAAAMDWAVNVMHSLAGTHEILSAEDSCRVQCLELTGTADAWVPALGMSADLKSGIQRNYREQMAAYALGFMEATFRSEWTAHLLFCDARVLVTHRFTYEEALEIVSGIIARFHDPAKQPTACAYCDWCSKESTCAGPSRKSMEALALTAPELLDVPQHAADGNGNNDGATSPFDRILADNERLGWFLSACADLDAFRAKAMEVATRRLESGEQIPGWTLAQDATPEVVFHDTVGRWMKRLGFGAVLAAYGDMDAATFREIWAAKMPKGTPIPDGVISPGKKKPRLRPSRSTRTGAPFQGHHNATATAIGDTSFNPQNQIENHNNQLP